MNRLKLNIIESIDGKFKDGFKIEIKEYNPDYFINVFGMFPNKDDFIIDEKSSFRVLSRHFDLNISELTIVVINEDLA